eukprot:gb/GFBE01067526.1/.p1 GENE.gb/GFBE01067526.1/~~gb/GFBE01067526.1/.p1  ORF type:complete len:100 (+),score=17.61 gb/GFBE01067526.1/:1-300(+)
MVWIDQKQQHQQSYGLGQQDIMMGRTLLEHAHGQPSAWWSPQKVDAEAFGLRAKNYGNPEEPLFPASLTAAINRSSGTPPPQDGWVDWLVCCTTRDKDE